MKESSERVRAAVKNSGLVFPGQRITINLAPANIRGDPLRECTCSMQTISRYQ